MNWKELTNWRKVMGDLIAIIVGALLIGFGLFLMVFKIFPVVLITLGIVVIAWASYQKLGVIREVKNRR
jgi:uncharacterized membrane protein